MTSSLLKFTVQTSRRIQICSTQISHSRKTPFLSLPIALQRHSHLCCSPQQPQKHKPNPILSSLKEQLAFSPPTTKEEAIQQAQKCLSKSLQKPLNNPILAGKLKKQKQPRFRVEIPVLDDSPESLTNFALEILSELPIKRKGAQVKILILWPNPSLKKLAIEATEFKSLSIENSDISSVIKEKNKLNSADVVVFLSPEAIQLEAMKAVCTEFYPKPAVVFNPKWSVEEESGFGLGGFVGSFEVVYSFMGLEVKGILSSRRGVVFCCGDGWVVLVEEEKGEMKVVTTFKKRPSGGDVEMVLYNLMAANSPVTRSLKFIRDLLTNVTGKKEMK